MGEKHSYMDTTSFDGHPFETKYGQIEQLYNLKYVGEIIQKTGQNTSGEDRIVKLQEAYRLTWNHYNERNISPNAKLRLTT